jgi:DNA-directed RNA polymerase alpha subunit
MQKIVTIHISSKDIEEWLISKGLIFEGEKISDYSWYGEKGKGISVQIGRTAYTEEQEKFLHTPIEELDTSVRLVNALKAANLSSMGEVVKLSMSDLMKFRNFSPKSITEINTVLSEKGLGPLEEK